MRLELIHLAAPPPQDGMSTNFTTAAKAFKHHSNEQFFISLPYAALLVLLFFDFNTRLLRALPNEPFFILPFLDLTSPFPMIVFILGWRRYAFS
jgi:hypothetical protein